MPGTLYLIPNALGESTVDDVISPQAKRVIQTIDDYLVESEKNARRYLRQMGLKKPFSEVRLSLLNEHTDRKKVPDLLRPLTEGKNMGILSDAGCPGVADPGAEAVRIAHQKGYAVMPLVGPCSILLALMGSGLNGQNFAFTGYLPIPQEQRRQRIVELERLTHRGQTQIFMETPYRNNALLADVLAVCRPETKLCLAADLTLPTAFLKTKTLREWSRGVPDLKKRPTLFLLGA